MFTRIHDLADTPTCDINEVLMADDKTLLERLIRFTSNMRGTSQYKYARRGEIVDMVEQLGLPTFS